VRTLAVSDPIDMSNMLDQLNSHDQQQIKDVTLLKIRDSRSPRYVS
jgi:hypothetical protein